MPCHARTHHDQYNFSYRNSSSTGWIIPYLCTLTAPSDQHSGTTRINCPRAPAQLIQQQPHPRQLQPPQRAVQLPKGLSQEEFADFADGDDSLCNILNLESFDASTRPANVLGLGEVPQQQPATSRNANATSARPTATTTGAKGKGRMSAIM